MERLLAQSQRIHDFAVNGEWEKAIALESERQILINECFSPQAEPVDPQMAMRQIQEIIELDKKAVAMGLEARKAIENALGDFQRGRQAAKAYQKIAP